MTDSLSLKITATLTESQLKKAVEFWLSHQGYDTKSISFTHVRGDRPGETSATTCTAHIEKKPYVQSKD